jgi:ribonuclease-3
MSAQEFGELPRYELTEDGPEHMKTFRAEVSVDGVVRGTGEGRTKKEAEQAAALEACEVLGDDMNDAVGASDDNTRGGAATGTGGDHG